MGKHFNDINLRDDRETMLSAEVKNRREVSTSEVVLKVLKNMKSRKSARLYGIAV